MNKNPVTLVFRSKDHPSASRFVEDWKKTEAVMRELIYEKIPVIIDSLKYIQEHMKKGNEISIDLWISDPRDRIPEPFVLSIADEGDKIWLMAHEGTSMIRSEIAYAYIAPLKGHTFQDDERMKNALMDIFRREGEKV